MPSQKEPTSYEVPNEELVDRFFKAAAEAGVSNSGFVMKLVEDSSLTYAAYLKGVLLARLDGVKPPYQPEDKVRVVGKGMVSPKHYRGWELDQGIHTVERVWYVDKRWWLELSGIPSQGTVSIYTVDRFELITEFAAA